MCDLNGIRRSSIVDYIRDRIGDSIDYKEPKVKPLALCNL
jgi:hypothetical protein